VVELLLGGENVNWDAFVATATYSKIYRCFETACKKQGYKFVARIKKNI